MSSLPEAVVGSTHSALVITAKRADNTILDLTGGTVTGRLKDKSSSAIQSIAGTLTVVDATGGQFRWTFGSADVSTIGIFGAQFTITYSDGTVERSLVSEWEVSEAYW